MILPKRQNSSHVPDVTKTGLLSSIGIKFSFSKRVLTKIALESPESLIGFPTVFEGILPEINTRSLFAIIGRALGLGSGRGAEAGRMTVHVK